MRALIDPAWRRNDEPSPDSRPRPLGRVDGGHGLRLYPADSAADVEQPSKLHRRQPRPLQHHRRRPRRHTHGQAILTWNTAGTGTRLSAVKGPMSGWVLGDGRP